MENCNDCPCNCKVMSDQCVTRFASIKDPTVLTADVWQKATDDIDDLLGVDCANELCNALIAAVATSNENPGTTFANYLAAKWLAVINNKYFQKWYANRLLWHWLDGNSISDIRAGGLIIQSNADEAYKNAFAQADKVELQRRITSANNNSTQGRTRFLNEYWYKNTNLYSCAVSECGCSKVYTCQKHVKKIGGIGFVIK